MEDAQHRLDMAMAAAKMAVWDSHIVNGKVEDGTVYWSADGAALLGLKRRAFDQPFSAFMAFVYPDDRDRVLTVIQDGAGRCSEYEMEYRVQWPDGSLHWLSAKAQGFCNPHGIPERTLGIVWDITERKRQELHTAEQKELAEVTLGSIGDGVMTTDCAGRTRYLNRVAEQLTGWSQETAQGVSIDQTLRLVEEKDSEPQEHVAMKCLRLKQSVGLSSRSQLLTRDGRRIAVENSAAPIWSASGQVLGAVVVFRDVSHERKMAQQLSWYASHDTLTGLMNRREFENQIAEALRSAKEDGHVHALLYIDLDQFKIVNDTCGHSAGDVLLQLLAKMLQTQMRDSDILARLGGDELGVLLPCCPPDHAVLIANELRQSIKNFRFVWDNRSFEIGASIGLVEVNFDSKSLTGLLVAADQACYMAKEQGRNRVHFYKETDVMLAQRQGEMLWVSRLKEAFEREHFRLFAMPIVNLNLPDHGHDEVLIRIKSGKGDLILPGAFIPAAERYDMMVEIDRWVIRAVCHHVKRVCDSLPGGRDKAACRSLYSINLSGMSLNDEKLHDYIIEQFAEFSISPEQICFEITETAAIANLPRAQIFMSRLKTLGCRFSLDDFGSGLSSFAYLKALPVDFLKIDGMFIRDIANNAINCALVKAINEVGHVMGIQTVAEYVEDDATLSLVRELGVDYAQGHAVGEVRPLELESV